MKMVRLLPAALILGAATFTTAAVAMDAEIEARQQLMQDAKAAMGAAGAMVQGKMPYDAKTAELAMRTLNAVGIGFPMFYSTDNSGDPDTESLAKVWEDMDGFKKGSAMLASSADGAAKKANEGLDAFKVAFEPVAKTCKGCHETFRMKKK